MKSKKSGDHKLALAILKLEGGKVSVNIGQCKEVLLALKIVLSLDEKMRVDFLNSLYTKIAQQEVDRAIVKARK